jgi:hypothetical protein
MRPEVRDASGNLGARGSLPIDGALAIRFNDGPRQAFDANARHGVSHRCFGQFVEFGIPIDHFDFPGIKVWRPTLSLFPDPKSVDKVACIYARCAAHSAMFDTRLDWREVINFNRGIRYRVGRDARLLGN